MENVEALKGSVESLRKTAGDARVGCCRRAPLGGRAVELAEANQGCSRQGAERFP